MTKLLVFANDPINSYVVKGEIKPRYFNPGDIFDDISVITPALSDADVADVQTIAGRARLEIIPLGNFRPSRPLSFFKYRRRALEVARRRKPDIIRSYNPQVFGYLGVYCGTKLGVPSVVSVHNDYDLDYRRLARQERQFRKWAISHIYRCLFEHYSLRRADAVLAVYRSASEYVRRLSGRDPELIYNRVYSSGPPKRHDSDVGDYLDVVSVGRLDHVKGHDILIRAAALDERIRLTIIGTGILADELRELGSNLGLGHRLVMCGSVPNRVLPHVLRTADVFALGRRMAELSIAIIEAASVGLPLVIAKVPHEEGGLEVFGDAALTIAPTPEAFSEAFKRLFADATLRDRLSANGYEAFSRISGEVMERREKMLYEQLLMEAGNKKE